MNMIIVLVALVAVVLAAPQGNPDKDAVIVKYANDKDVDNYNFAYETSNKISQQEGGQIQNAGTDNEAIAVRGSWSYIGPDGVTYTVNYIADENGFQPEGAHIPRAA